jgi:hypothetical protein
MMQGHLQPTHGPRSTQRWRYTMQAWLNVTTTAPPEAVPELRLHATATVQPIELEDQFGRRGASNSGLGMGTRLRVRRKKKPAMGNCDLDASE